MIKYSKHIITSILLIALLPLGLLAFDNSVAQGSLISKYFAKKLGVNVNRIEVELIHASDIDPKLLRSGRIHVQGRRGSFNLGHQTLWLVHKVNGVIKRRFPATVDVHANLMVPTATRNISRQEILTEDQVALVSKRVGREFQRIVFDTDAIYKKMATQMIREGRAIERNMVRNRPDILLGDNLQIILKDKGLQFELPGIAKEEGLIGEEIRVQCPTTRKEFRGVLENTNEVLVSLR